MRVVFLILGLIAMIGLVLTSLLLGLRATKEVGEYHQMFEMVAAAQGMPSKGAWQLAQITGLFTFMAGLFGILAFVLKDKAPLLIASIVAVLSILLVIVTPSTDKSAIGAANPQPVALVAMVLALIAAGCHFARYRLKQKKSAE